MIFKFVAANANGFDGFYNKGRLLSHEADHVPPAPERGREFMVPFVFAAEMAGVGEAATSRNVFKGVRGPAHQLLRLLQPHLAQRRFRAALLYLPEEPAEVAW